MRLAGWRLVRIRGTSMVPLLQPDSYGLFGRTRRLKAGDTVLADHPKFGQIVKRIYKIGDDKVWLEGIASGSTSKQSLGAVKKQLVLGRLLLKFPPPKSHPQPGTS